MHLVYVVRADLTVVLSSTTHGTITYVSTMSPWVEKKTCTNSRSAQQEVEVVLGDIVS